MECTILNKCDVETRVREKGSLNTPKKSNTRCIFMVAFFLLAASFLTWECFAYLEVKRSLGEAIESIHVQRLEIESLKYQWKSREKSGSETTSLRKSVANINLCGRNGQTEKSKRGRPISDWKKSLHSGNISYKGGYVIIKTPGIYYVYAQMFFYQNDQHFTKKWMDFYIAKTGGNRLALATVPLNSCKVVCTHHISRMVNLTKDERLYVSSYSNGIQFKMAPDKTQFGVYLIQEI